MEEIRKFADHFVEVLTTLKGQVDTNINSSLEGFHKATGMKDLLGEITSKMGGVVENYLLGLAKGEEAPAIEDASEAPADHSDTAE